MLLPAGAALGTRFYLSQQQHLSGPAFVRALLATAVPASIVTRDLHHGCAEPGFSHVQGRHFGKQLALLTVHKLPPFSSTWPDPSLSLLDGFSIYPQNGTQLEMTLNNPQRS